MDVPVVLQRQAPTFKKGTENGGSATGPIPWLGCGRTCRVATTGANNSAGTENSGCSAGALL